MRKPAGDGVEIRHCQAQAFDYLPRLHHVICIGLLYSFGVSTSAVGVEQVPFCCLDPP